MWSEKETKDGPFGKTVMDNKGMQYKRGSKREEREEQVYLNTKGKEELLKIEK